MPSLAGCKSHLCRLCLSSSEKAALPSLIGLPWKSSGISRVPTICNERLWFLACLHQYLDGFPTWLCMSPYIKSNLLSLNSKGCLFPPPYSHHNPILPCIYLLLFIASAKMLSSPYLCAPASTSSTTAHHYLQRTILVSPILTFFLIHNPYLKLHTVGEFSWFTLSVMPYLTYCNYLSNESVCLNTATTTGVRCVQR